MLSDDKIPQHIMDLTFTDLKMVPARGPRDSCLRVSRAGRVGEVMTALPVISKSSFIIRGHMHTCIHLFLGIDVKSHLTVNPYL